MAVERQREYETIYILRPDANDDDQSEARERFEGVLEDYDGHVLTFDDWGRRELAYEILDSTSGQRFDRGRYHYFRYIGPGGVVSELERNLKLLDPVIKFLTVKLDDDLIPKERLARSEDEEPEVLPYQAEEE
ncbi:MAG: 30S ribosomal protein S6 [Persicimonas sp.]